MDRVEFLDKGVGREGIKIKKHISLLCIKGGLK